MKENDLRYSEKIKFNKEQVKKIVEQENFDVCINLSIVTGKPFIL